MVKINITELIGPALDWAVAKCEGVVKPLNYSTDWSHGGPILEREKIAIGYDHDCWNAAKFGLPWFIGSLTPLVAAMRCYVTSKLGDEVEIPEELL